jgi:hypothetical protein
MDEKPDIKKQLRDAQEQREKLLEQLKQSESIIASIETRLSEVTKSQEARLRADDRVDNALLDSVQNKKQTRSDLELPTSVSESESAVEPSPSPKTDHKRKDTPANGQQIMNGDTRWYEIVIDEDGNKHERLRKK